MTAPDMKAMADGEAPPLAVSATLYEHQPPIKSSAKDATVDIADIGYLPSADRKIMHKSIGFMHFYAKKAHNGTSLYGLYVYPA